jgi:predicted transposase/invertase (TIGR01784 family)
MKLFSLTVDFAFKALFAPNPDLLMDLLNSFPSFQGYNRIKNLKVLNPEIPKKISDEKLSILDIRAENENGENFLIEMQAFPQSSFSKRTLYYWAKVYSRGLGKGHKYENLKKVYSVNFVNFPIWKNHIEYLSTFQLLEKDRIFPLTEDLEIHIIEISKFLKSVENLQSDLDTWFYLLKEASNLKGESMKTLEKKNPAVKRAISELKTLSLTAKNRELYESRRKAELDYASGMSDAFNEGLEKGIEQGIEKGIEKGLEGFYLGIQLNLETRFNLKEDSIMNQIRKSKDIEKLKKILIQSAKAKTFAEFKKSLK